MIGCLVPAPFHCDPHPMATVVDNSTDSLINVLLVILIVVVILAVIIAVLRRI